MESTPPLVRQDVVTGQRHLVAQQAYRAGDLLCKFGARETLGHPSYLTLQTGIGVHILLDPEYLQYCNHSCAPNIFFDTTTMEVVALRDIEDGEELTFFYPSTEWDMAQPFACNCGSDGCLETINGAMALADEVLKQYRLTDFIMQCLQKQAVISQSV